MRNSLFIAIVVLATIYSCGQTKTTTKKEPNKNNIQLEKNTNETKCSLQELADKENLKIKQLDNTCLFNNHLYLLSSLDRKAYIYDLSKNQILTPQKLNKLIDSLHSYYSDPQQIYINDDGVFVGFNKGFIVTDFNYKIKSAHKTTGVINYQIFDKDKLAAITADSVYIYDYLDAQLKRRYESGLSMMNFIKSSNGNYLNSDFLSNLNYNSADSVFIGGKIVPGKNLGFKPFQDGYIGFVGDDFVIWFIYGKRNKMIVTDKQMSKVIRVISFGKIDLSTADEDMMNVNEYYKDFSIDMSRNIFYITRFRNHSLTILKGCL